MKETDQTHSQTSRPAPATMSDDELREVVGGCNGGGGGGVIDTNGDGFVDTNTNTGAGYYSGE